MLSISIIIPAYNEEKRIGATLEAYSKHFESLRKKKILDYSIIIVINNTHDRTPEIVASYAKKNPRIITLIKKRGGKGYAIIEGFKEALKSGHEMMGFVDADMATSPQSFYDLIRAMEENHAVIASRYLPGAQVKPKPTNFRIMSSRIFNLWIKAVLMLNYKDTQCGAKIFRREAIQRVLPHLSVLEYAFDVDLLYTLKKLGLKTREVPTVWSDKNYSKVNFAQSAPRMALTVLKLRMINSPLKIFFKSDRK
jgi:glycosyltransferase involved in cell wall biosynthesis